MQPSTLNTTCSLLQPTPVTFKLVLNCKTFTINKALHNTKLLGYTFLPKIIKICSSRVVIAKIKSV